MGLLDLQTDLKSLKYGQDRPNGGSSGQPYIQTDIRTVDATFGGANLTLYDDGLVRGGMVAAQNAAATDTLRIAKFFTDPPKGPLFLVKQVGLQLSNPQLERKGNTTERYVGPSRIYNLGINTLAQVPLTAFGEHIVRHGILPINDPDTYYESVVTANNFQSTDSKDNRLIKYATKFTLGGEGGIINKSWNDDLELNKYVSGPNSTYGIGNTIISRYTNTNDKSKIDAAFDRSKSFAGISRETTDTLKTTSTVDYGLSNKINSVFSDKDFTDLPSQIIPGTPIPFFTSSNADTGSHSRNGTLPAIENKNDLTKNGPSSYPLVNNNKLGPLNLPQTVYNFTNPNLKTYSTISNKIKNQTSKGTPLIHTNIGNYKYNSGTKVVFNRVNDRQVDKDTLAIIFKPINPFTGVEFTSLKFLAYLKDYSDSFDSSWNDVKYVGRAEKFYIFNEFKRSITFSFSIPCFNKKELAAKHSTLNNLVSITAGNYTKGLLGGIITYLTLGNYIANQPGIITNINFKPIDGSSWDLDDKLAFYIDVSVSFTLIHDFVPEYNKPFINVPGGTATKTTTDPMPDPPPKPTPTVTDPPVETYVLEPIQLIQNNDYLGTGGGFENASGNNDAQRAFNESRFGLIN
jgi:hypothetical protein